MPWKAGCSLLVLAGILSILRPSACQADPWENDHDTLVIDADNFSEIVSQHKLIMVRSTLTGLMDQLGLERL